MGRYNIIRVRMTNMLNPSILDEAKWCRHLCFWEISSTQTQIFTSVSVVEFVVSIRNFVYYLNSTHLENKHDSVDSWSNRRLDDKPDSRKRIRSETTFSDFLSYSCCSRLYESKRPEYDTLLNSPRALRDDGRSRRRTVSIILYNCTRRRSRSRYKTLRPGDNYYAIMDGVLPKCESAANRAWPADRRVPSGIVTFSSVKFTRPQRCQMF